MAKKNGKVAAPKAAEETAAKTSKKEATEKKANEWVNIYGIREKNISTVPFFKEDAEGQKRKMLNVHMPLMIDGKVTDCNVGVPAAFIQPMTKQTDELDENGKKVRVPVEGRFNIGIKDRDREFEASVYALDEEGHRIKEGEKDGKPMYKMDTFSLKATELAASYSEAMDAIRAKYAQKEGKDVAGLGVEDNAIDGADIDMGDAY